MACTPLSADAGNVARSRTRANDRSSRQGGRAGGGVSDRDEDDTALLIRHFLLDVSLA